MARFLERAKQFLVADDGPTATEYAVMLALVIVALVGAIGLLRQGIEDSFSNTTDALNATGGGGGGGS